MPPRTSRRSPSRITTRRCTARIAATTITATLLSAAPAAAVSSAPETEMTIGSHGSQVADVQRALHLPGSGRFGPKTGAAVRRFQRSHRLLVDGIVGIQTWDALFHIRPTALASSAVPSAGAGYSIPAGIVQCESGGNYSAVNASSGAGGAYQIMPSTWHAYGGQGLPQDAPKAQQDRIASAIYANQGPGAWTC